MRPPARATAPMRARRDPCGAGRAHRIDLRLLDGRPEDRTDRGPRLDRVRVELLDLVPQLAGPGLVDLAGDA